MGNNTFYCADLHLGHKNMATAYRGFSSVEEHDETIIRNWNSVVTKRDKVYVLGDITMEKQTNYHLLSRLNGIIYAVGGNHDKPNHVRKMLEHVNHFAGMIDRRDKELDVKMVLTHCPIHPSELKRFNLNIHGHIHKKRVRTWYGAIDKRYICVSMEHIDYTPQTLPQLLKRFG